MGAPLTPDQFRRRRRRWAVAAIVIVAFWVIGGPGRKYDEGVGIMFMGMVLSAIALGASLRAPSRVFNAVFYPLIFGLGYAKTNLHVELKYGYETFREFWLVQGAKMIGIGFVVLAVVNLLMLLVTHQLFAPKGLRRA
jgi:hypothetical protein